MVSTNRSASSRTSLTTALPLQGSACCPSRGCCACAPAEDGTLPCKLGLVCHGMPALSEPGWAESSFTCAPWGMKRLFGRPRLNSCPCMGTGAQRTANIHSLGLSMVPMVRCLRMSVDGIPSTAHAKEAFSYPRPSATPEVPHSTGTNGVLSE